MFNIFKILNSLKLRRKLFLAFFIFTCAIIYIASVSFWFYIKRGRLSDVTTDIENIMIKTLQIVKSEQDFFAYEPYNFDFYKTGRSPYLDAHKNMIVGVKDHLSQTLKRPAVKDFDIDQDLEKLLGILEEYEGDFKKVVGFMRLRGFSDMGLEGKMKDFVTQIETRNFEPTKILQIKLYEKDYFYFKNPKVAILLKNSIKKLQIEALNNPNLSETQKNEIVRLWQEYLRCFKRIDDLELEMGYNSQTGLRGQMRTHADKAIAVIDEATKKVNQKSVDLRGDFQNIFIITLLLTIILSLTFSYFLSFFITIPILNLSTAMRKIVASHFSDTFEPIKKYTNDEVGDLTEDFNYMLREIKTQIDEIKESTTLLEDKNEGLLAVNNHISDSEQRLQGLLSVNDTFFSIISHDLRSPLNTLIGFLELLYNHAESFSPEELKDFSQQMVAAIRRIVDLLENLLQWSRAKTGKIEIDPTNVPLHILAEDNLALVIAVANGKNVQLKNLVPQDTQVYADKNVMNFVLRNLISNAIKFTHKGGEVSISAIKEDDYIKIGVNDTGVGMSPEDVQKVFQPNVHHTTLGTEKEKGTGFGLMMCKDFVEKNGGYIYVESELGKGTSIYFSLPVGK